MKNYKITIPKPCHEDWTQMTPNDKGRFCGSCTKTVVDFTKKSANEIQSYFKENQGGRVCGHFKRIQLDSIVLQIPETIFHQQLSFQKTFILALLFVMGTTLLSCKKEDGKSQKIDRIELIDTVLKIEKGVDTIDSSITEQDTLGIINVPKQKACNKKSIPAPADYEVILTGDLEIEEDLVEGEVLLEEYSILPFGSSEIPPIFKGIKTLNNGKLRAVFESRMKEFVTKNFDTNIHEDLGLTAGKLKIYAQFTIDSLGNVGAIKVRAPHQKIKRHITELVQKLPQFIPGQQNGKNVNIRYTLPIIFKVE